MTNRTVAPRFLVRRGPVQPVGSCVVRDGDGTRAIGVVMRIPDVGQRERRKRQQDRWRDR